MAQPPASPQTRPQRGIQSIEVGGRLLRTLADAGRPMALKDLAGAAAMSPAKAHPYLVSFGKLGLIVQDSTSAQYRLGPLAMQLGLISLQQVDPVRLASDGLAALAREVGHTVAIAVWGSHGPTIVRIEAGPASVHVNMRHGTVMSLRGTASGRLFEAHRRGPSRRGGLTAGEREAVRRAGFALAVDGAVAGVSALAVPVFDAAGTMVLSLTAIGPSVSLEVAANGAPIRRLLAAARALNLQLGGTAPIHPAKPLAQLRR